MINSSLKSFPSAVCICVYALLYVLVQERTNDSSHHAHEGASKGEYTVIRKTTNINSSFVCIASYPIS